MHRAGTAKNRDVVDQATDVLAAQFGLHPEDAFDELETVARDEHCALCDVATRIVEQNGL